MSTSVAEPANDIDIEDFFDLYRFIQRFKCNGYTLEVGTNQARLAEGYGLWVYHTVEDSREPGKFLQVSVAVVSWQFPISQERVLELLQKQLYVLAAHEIDETFKLDGKHVRDPHPK